jgi:hypothetical protein
MKEVKKIDKIKDKTVSEVKKKNRGIRIKAVLFFQKKIWIAGAILSLMIILLFLIFILAFFSLFWLAC